MSIELVRKEDVVTYGKLVEHHVKYKEIHGEDKTIFMPRSEHRRLHIRLRKEGKCNVPTEELYKIASRAYNRKKPNLWKEIDKRVKERILSCIC